jgi:serine-type D-Ala-D-Ala carboxypeptidase/endopeptidase
MTMKSRTSRFGIVLLLSLLIFSPTHVATAQGELTDDEIRSILQDRIDRAKKGVGMVVGIVDRHGMRVISYGKASQNDNRLVNGDSVFEIGSITKVFTAVLLADMVERGEVNLNDPISKYLPKSVRTPTHNGEQITLLHLATHTSGLPNLPDNLTPKDNNNPFADYTIEQMYAFLSSYTLRQDIGTEEQYSNYGFGLLGHILALRTRTDYGTLIRTRVCQPLGMDSTGIERTSGMQSRLVMGHNCSCSPVANIDMPTLAGAGALYSTANDLLKFLAANLGLSNSPLQTAMQTTQQPQHDAHQHDLGQLAWRALEANDEVLLYRGGATVGFKACIGMDKKGRKGVVILSNTKNEIIDDFGQHLLNSHYPLAKIETRKDYKIVRVNPNLYDGYCGAYHFAADPSCDVVISRAGDRLFLTLNHFEPLKWEMFAKSETEFFLKFFDMQITFLKDNKGQVTGLKQHAKGDRKLEKVN